MKLNNPIVIYPPPYSDNNGNVITPTGLLMDELLVTYHDNPSQKTVTATIKNIPNHITLLQGQSYDDAGDYSQAFIEQKLREALGDNPAQSLRALFPKTLEENPNGTGSILAGMIHSLGIKMTANCSCRRHALEMNEKGPEWCEQNIDTILSWLEEESKKRSIPFVKPVAKLMVQRAIAVSKKLSLKNNINLNLNA